MIDLLLKNTTYLNVFTKEFLKGNIGIDNGLIIGFGNYDAKVEIDLNNKYVVPGFIDSHIHLESSMVVPNEFAKVSIAHGTTSIITDPHEIANVCGNAGIDFMLESTKDLPIDIYFMVPSCVPSSKFDETGYKISLKDIKKYLSNKRFLGLAEMMNYPGVIFDDKETLEKIELTKKMNKIIDGHAPLLSGDDLNKYVSKRIYSDHECSNYNEAYEKIRLGMNIMIREGTAGKNLEDLKEIIKKLPDRCMFSTDDKHPSDILNGHIDSIIKKAIKLGIKLEEAYTIASFNAAKYFKLDDKGAIAPGFVADLVVLDDLKNCNVIQTYKNGKDVNIDEIKPIKINKNVLSTVKFKKITKDSIKLRKSKVIGLIPNEIITKDEGESSGVYASGDILKICVIERYHNTGHIGLAYIKGYGLKKGAIGTTIAHDSHNIIIVGANDDDILLVAERLKNINGGIVLANKKILGEIVLPIGGLMANISVKEMAKKIEELKNIAYDMGVNKQIDPFMTLSFVSLPVIPNLKLTTLGIVDVNKFELIK